MQDEFPINRDETGKTENAGFKPITPPKQETIPASTVGMPEPKPPEKPEPISHPTHQSKTVLIAAIIVSTLVFLGFLAWQTGNWVPNQPAPLEKPVATSPTTLTLPEVSLTYSWAQQPAGNLDANVSIASDGQAQLSQVIQVKGSADYSADIQEVPRQTKTAQLPESLWDAFRKIVAETGADNLRAGKTCTTHCGASLSAVALELNVEGQRFYFDAEAGEKIPVWLEQMAYYLEDIKQYVDQQGTEEHQTIDAGGNGTVLADGSVLTSPN